MKRIIPAVLAAFLAGCGDDGGPTDRELVAQTEVIDGIEHVSYPATRGAPLDWRPDTIFALGDALAEDEYQFDQVTSAGLAGDEAGNVYVLDRQGGRVLKYAADGRHAATYGRKGGGPGELSQPVGLALGPGDTVWVSEFAMGGAGRMTGFPQDGGEPRVVSYADQAGFPFPDLAVLEQGVYQRFRPMVGPGALPGMRGGRGGEAPQQMPLLRLDRQMQPRDTVWMLPEPPTDLVQLEIGNRVAVMMMPREYSPPFQWRVLSDGGVVLSDTAAYLLRVLDADGGVERVILREPAPRAVTEADREAARERLRSQEGGGIRIGGGGPSPEMQQRMLEQRLEKMTFADIVPRIVRLRVDPLDRIWVGVSEDVAGEIGRIDIYDRDGRLMGELRDFPMPDAFIGPDAIALLGRDDMDVQQVTVARLSPRRPS